MHLVQFFAPLRVGEDAPDGARNAICPGPLSRRVGDQILADLDDSMGQPPPRAVAPHAVTGKLAVIGFVLANDYAGI